MVLRVDAGQVDAEVTVTILDGTGEPNTMRDITTPEGNALFVLPRIEAEFFKLEVQISRLPAERAAEIRVVELLALTTENANLTASMRVGDQKLIFESITDSKILQKYGLTKENRREVWRAAPEQPLKAEWYKSDKWSSKKIPQTIRLAVKSVVRLRKEKAWSCYGTENFAAADQDVVHCTAFRVGGALFATAWHCLNSEFQGRLQFYKNRVLRRRRAKALKYRAL